MAINYLDFEKEWFNNLLKKFNKQEKINLDTNLVPNQLNNNVTIYYNLNSPLWLIRIPSGDNEVFYYFGLNYMNSFESKNVSPSLLLKVNRFEPKSFVKFFESNNVFIEVKIRNFNELAVENYLFSHFDVGTYEIFKNRLFILLGKDYEKQLNTIESLINRLDFDLSIKNKFLIIKGIKTYSKSVVRKSPKTIQNVPKKENDKTSRYTYKFNIERLDIITPEKYISDSDRNGLINEDNFLKLVANFDEISDSRRVILNHLDEIIEKANLNYIEHEKSIKSKEFRRNLDNHEGIVTDEEKRIFKDKYSEEYYDYYAHLNFAYSIDIYNKKTINEEKDIFLKQFKEELSVRTQSISDLDRAKFKVKYNKDYYKFYDKLEFDDIIDEFNDNLAKEEKQFDYATFIPQSENYEVSVDEMLSKIDFTLFDGESFANENLMEDFEDLVESPIFDIVCADLDDDESSKLTIKIKEDISGEKISGDVADIIDFYIEQYKSIKKQYSLNIFLNNYVEGEDFKGLLSTYDSYTESMISDIIDHVRKDISADDSMDNDMVILKLEYYFKAESNKLEYFKQIDEIRGNSNYYIMKFNITLEEFNEILDYIQIKINEGYHIKNITNCLNSKIKEKIDMNRDESRLKLRKLLNNPEFIEKNNITPEQSTEISEYVGNLIFENRIRSHKITESYLLIFRGRSS